MGKPLHQKKTATLALSALGLLACLSATADRERIRIDVPAHDQPILDLAEIIEESDETRIAYLAETLRQEKGVSLFVVTIPSMLSYNDSVMPIETYARVLYEQWGRDEAFAVRENWQAGLLLLVSPGDRCARIELGRSWRGEADPYCKKIMDEIMVPAFRQGKFSEGVLEGARKLDRIARGDRPKPGTKVPQELLGLLALPVLASPFILGTFLMIAEKPPRRRKRRKGNTGDDFDWGSDYSGGSSSDYGGGGGATGRW